MSAIIRGPNKLSDPGFELGGAIWNNGGAGTVETVSDGNTHSGGKRFKYSNNGSGGPNLLSEEFPCAPGRTYFAACWTIGPGAAAGTSQLAIRWRDATHTQIQRDVVASVLGPAPIYTYLSGVAVAPAGAAFVVLDYGENTVDSTVNPWYVDDLEFSLVQSAFPRLPGALSRLATPPSFGPASRNWTQAGRTAAHGAQQFGRTWDETYPVLDTQNPNVRAFLETINRSLRESLVWDVQHPYWHIRKGAGGGNPLLHCPPQLVPDPENFAAAGWSISGTPTKTPGQIDPYGGRAAYSFNDTDAANFQTTFEVVPFIGDGEKAFAIFIQQGSAPSFWFRLRDSTAGIDRHNVLATWTAGVPVLTDISGAGAKFTPENWGNGWWRVAATATGIIAANSNFFEYGVGPFNVGATGTIILFGANAWNSTVVGPYRGPTSPGPLGFPLTQEGSKLYVRGAPVSTAKWLRQGDIFDAIGMPVILDVTADVDSDVNGGAVININPPVFSGTQLADGLGLAIDPSTVFFNAVIADLPDYPLMDGSRYVDAGLTISWREEPA